MSFGHSFDWNVSNRGKKVCEAAFTGSNYKEKSRHVLTGGLCQTCPKQWLIAYMRMGCTLFIVQRKEKYLETSNSNNSKCQTSSYV